MNVEMDFKKCFLLLFSSNLNNDDIICKSPGLRNGCEK